MRDVHDALMIRNSKANWCVARCRLTFRFIAGRSAWPLSILHRVTGVALGVGTLLLTWWLIAAASSDDAFEAQPNGSWDWRSVCCFCLAGRWR